MSKYLTLDGSEGHTLGVARHESLRLDGLDTKCPHGNQFDARLAEVTCGLKMANNCVERQRRLSLMLTSYLVRHNK